jgi:hypothetical protein
MISGGMIEQNLALVHPALDRPIGFIGNTPVASLLQPLLAGSTVRSIDAPGDTAKNWTTDVKLLLAHWQAMLPGALAAHLLDSFIARGVIVIE